MIPDRDIYRSTAVLVKQHDQNAPIHAAMRADELLEAGDMEGCVVLKRVLKAVEELLSKERPPPPAALSEEVAAALDYHRPGVRE